MTKTLGDKLIHKRPNHIPTIVSLDRDYDGTHKLLVKNIYSVSQVIVNLRISSKLDPTQCYVPFVNGKLVKSSDNIGALYYSHRNPNDGCLHINLMTESTFG